MDESTKERLIAQFRAYLDTDTVDEETQQTDLFSLFTELAALRNEVKLESRQVKNALDLFKGTFDTLQASNDQLINELEHCRSEQNRQLRENTRTLLLAFLDVYDRLDAGMTTLNSYTSSSWRHFCKRETRLIRGLQEGQAMTLRRLDKLLASYGVHPLDVLNKPLDPHCMRAVEVDSQPQMTNGIVTGELRKGFMWKEVVLRPAEVKVNKIINP
ncbi:MAG TPA: nucleotide exchange factor GrpE [Thioploca sp.]|nr:MAG: nucleotide exchange factor GrpE [Gammaproteobacteria bacterium]HDN25543.1 nucleotide exchange factor GrpE [Thioploca sp.]